jgi:glycosyltransferase involved in cell wall biosynthesis
MGLGIARNNAVTSSRGNFLSFLDTDDLFTKGRVNELLSLFQKNPDLDIAFGSVAQFVDPDLGLKLSINPQLIKNAMPGCYIGTMMIKKTSFLKVGMFKHDIDLAYFMEWYARAEENGLKINKTDYPVVLRRIHLDNLGIRKRNSFLMEHAKVIKAILDRRRKNQI